MRNRLLLLLAVLLLATTAHAQSNTARVAWDPVPGATSYRVYVGAESIIVNPAAYTTSFDTAGADTSVTVTFPGSGRHFTAVKALNAAGESVSFSREVTGWPDPEVVAVPVSCAALPAGGVRCTAEIAGHNFAPDAVASLPYPGVTAVSSTRSSATEIVFVFDIAPNAAGGDADLNVTQSWAVTPGTLPQGVPDDGEVGGQQATFLPGAVTVTPVVLPGAAGNYRFGS